MFWNDNDLVKKRGARLYMPPPIPETDWKPPREFPNLSAATIISFDTETKDTTLNQEGPGWARGKAHVVGASIAAMDARGNRGAWYFPIRHEVGSEDNLDPSRVLPWLNQVLDTPHIPKIGANLTYDIGNLICEGVNVSGPLHDVQYAEALIDQEAFVALEMLGRKYLGQGKTVDLLKEWCKQAYPHTKPTLWRSDIYRAPPKLVGPYAIDDAFLPLEIWQKQTPIIETEQLSTVYRLECDLIPLMIKMRLQGVPVDIPRAEQMISELTKEADELRLKIYHEYGYNLPTRPNGLPVTDSGALSKLFDYVGIKYEYTDAGNASIKKEWLASLDHPLGDLLNDVREHEKIIGTFLQGYILDKSINGKLYPQFHQLRGDEGGTIVGRFSSSDPNLQNIPARTKLGKKVRECFTIEKGYHSWTKLDQSQVHYRILAHYAVGPGAEELRQAYINDPSTDYHWNVYNRVAPLMDWDTSDDDINEFRRRPIKNVNFGLLYGQSEKALKYKTAMYFGGSLSNEQVEGFFKAYFEGAPYVKPTMKAIGQEVQFKGYVETLLGRRIRFNLFEPAKRERGEYSEPLPYEAALREYGAPLKRAYEYRGVNYKFQGSEPDIIKKGMLDCYNSGVFEFTGYPLVTVHDEIDWQKKDDSTQTREAFKFIAHTMTHCIPMRVPLKVDEETGADWGSVKKVK